MSSAALTMNDPIHDTAVDVITVDTHSPEHNAGHDYERMIARTLADLGITEALFAHRCLPFCREAQQLEVAETDATGRDYLVLPQVARAWRVMKQAAQQDGVVIELVSAFRSVARQVEIIQGKLASGVPIETILTLSAPPGYSEHHTGRAIDINTPGCEATEEPFEHTDAFRWLTVHAHRFGFTLSYPRGNTLGFVYEPWHWCYQPGLAQTASQ
jgi:D-alanyl-D-alanine carboxypeptidase